MNFLYKELCLLSACALYVNIVSGFRLECIVILYDL